MTEAPETTEPEMSAETIERLVAQWRRELEGEQSLRASDVQDRLLDLWGHLPEGEVRAEVERWLTETLNRHVYAASDVDRRLEGLVAGEG